MKFKCDIDPLKTRIKWLNLVFYTFLLVSLLVYYFYPKVFIIRGSLIGVVICFAIWHVLGMIKDHYRGSLEKHRSEIIDINEWGIEYHHEASGYRFKKSNEEILAVKFTRFLGTPKIKVRFTHNEVFDFFWFKDSDVLYRQLKHKESLR
ncbi:hypothetical protein [Vibrio rumoiensis]|uniref:Uncharacterized protein n=1 Tax=Vibrio rumoiensis 1S-45 TaxID=1188252 RepID=A0A1E5E4X7_9VIBR|nr:hypothetical protein [Vibrio rumoiensis]OEF28168.1 hypothetical protein A1QC_05875 [Vibrio rumoiensis 1S-45]